MWSDHLAEVRWCGLAVATHILQQNRSPPSIRQNFPGGLWNLAVIILMDAKECCLVRDQVHVRKFMVLYLKIELTMFVKRTNSIEQG